MDAVFTINGVNFLNYASESGIGQGIVERQGREIITLDGTRYYKAIKKRVITYSAIEIKRATLLTLLDALETNPATVVYIDDAREDVRTATFYISDVKSTTKLIIDGEIYYTGFGFTLEER